MFRTIVLSFVLVVSARAVQPNFVFFMTDDQSTYTLGCYGNKDVKTPCIDQLAADGMVFDRHYAPTAICMASRATVMTGMYEYKTGCNFSHGDMLTETWRKSYPILLREAGYLTAFAGKFGFDLKGSAKGKRLPLPAADFDRWGGGPSQTSYVTAQNESMKAYAAEYPHSTLSYGAFGRDFVRQAADSGKPFCLSISFKAPHMPAMPDPRFDSVYAGKTFTKPANFGRQFGEHFAAQSKVARQYERFYSWNYADKYDQVMALYHQQIHAVDVAVGMVREELKKQGLAENTVIIFTSDNGFFCGSHGYGSKVLPYEESSRVPMIMLDPRAENSGKLKRCSALTSHIDFAATFLDMAGVEIPAAVDGVSLAKLYAEPEAAIHESVALINVWGRLPTHSLSVVTQDAKYIYWGYSKEAFEATEELYVLSRDPLELVNQANNPEHQGRMKKMRSLYDAHLGQWKDFVVPYNGYKGYVSRFEREAE